MIDRQNKMKEGQHTTSYIKHLAVSGLLSVLARIKVLVTCQESASKCQTFHIRNRYGQG